MHRVGRAHEGEPRAPVTPLCRRALEILEEARALDGVPIGISDGDPGSGAAIAVVTTPTPKGFPTIRQEVGDRAGGGLKSNMSRKFHMSLRNLDSFNGLPCLSPIEYER